MIKRFFLLLTLIILYSCGSYHDSIDYSVNENRDVIISKLSEIKTKNQSFRVYNSSNNTELKDKIKEDNTYFYRCYFTLDKNVVVLFVINISSEIPKQPTNISLVSVSTDKDMRNWKRLNSKEINVVERERVAKLFEDEVLSQFKANWERRSF